MLNHGCRHFRGERPCDFNKLDGSECDTCAHASVPSCRVLIVKLDALGDVLRTGSLLPAIIEKHAHPFISWLTRPEAVDLVRMMPEVDEVIPLTTDGLARIAAGDWDYVYSLSNDRTSASLARMSGARHEVIGFTMKDGSLHASNPAAERWLEMACFDREKKLNEQSYQQIMLDVIGSGQKVTPPRIEVSAENDSHAKERLSQAFQGSSRQRVAVNVGSGSRWPKKMLSCEQIAEYVAALQAETDVDVVLVGGDNEASKAQAVVAHGKFDTVATCLTPHLHEFVALLRHTDVIVCGDTLALHVASAIGLPAVCLFGPTSQSEIPEFDGQVLKVWAKGLDCLGCYGDCDREQNCMSLLKVEEIVALTRRQLEGRLRA